MLSAIETSQDNNSLKEQIIAIILADNKISISKIAGEIGKGITVTKKYIARLKTENRIERIGPDKGGYWVIRENSPILPENTQGRQEHAVDKNN
jgi:predicted HTH transcriptional regulator